LDEIIHFRVVQTKGTDNIQQRPEGKVMDLSGEKEHGMDAELGRNAIFLREETKGLSDTGILVN
jgi:hypothetical protein